MTDWNTLRHAYGSAADMPELLAQLSLNPRASVWDELWSRLCHLFGTSECPACSFKFTVSEAILAD